MRYVGQEHAVTVDLDHVLFETRDFDGIKAAFDKVHSVHYGYASPDQPAEIVSLRASVIGLVRKPPQDRIEEGGPTAPASASGGARPVYFRSLDGYVDTPTFARTGLLAGNLIEGPALIEEYASTTVIHPGDVLVVDPHGNLVIDIRRT